MVYRVLPKRVGRRGVCLIGAAYQALSTGWTQIAQPPLGRSAEVYRLLFSVASPQVWGWVWLTVGAFCLIGAFSLRLRNIAYAALLFLLFIVLMAFLAAAVTGAYRGWASVGWYAAWLVIFQTVAGWPEPGHLAIPHPRWRRRAAE